MSDNFNNMPDLDVPEVETSGNAGKPSSAPAKNFVKQEEDDGGRKMFSNKKANIAMIVVGAILVIGIIAVAIWAKRGRR